MSLLNKLTATGSGVSTYSKINRQQMWRLTIGIVLALTAVMLSVPVISLLEYYNPTQNGCYQLKLPSRILDHLHPPQRFPVYRCRGFQNQYLVT